MSERSGIVFVPLAIVLSFGHVSDGNVVAISTDRGRHKGDQIGIYCQVDGNFTSVYLERGDKTVIFCNSNGLCQAQMKGYSFDEKASNSTYLVFQIKYSGDTDRAEWTCRDSSGYYKSTTLELAPTEQGPTYAHLENQKISVECGEIKITGPMYLERFDDKVWIFVASCTQEGCVCNSNCSFGKATRRHKMFVFNVDSATTPDGTGFRCGSGDSWGNITYFRKDAYPTTTNNAGTSHSPEYSLLATLFCVCGFFSFHGD